MKMLSIIGTIMLFATIHAVDIAPANWEPEGGSKSPAKCSAKTIELDGREAAVLCVNMERRENFWGDVHVNLKDIDAVATPVLSLRFRPSAETKELDLPLPSVRATDKKGARVVGPKSIFKTNEDGWIYVTWDISTVEKLDLPTLLRIGLVWQYGQIPEGKTAEFQVADVKLSAKE